VSDENRRPATEGGGEDRSQSPVEPEQSKPPRRNRQTPRRGTGSQLDAQHGVRAMKIYPVTNSDIRLLKQYGLLSSGFLTLSGILFSVYFNINISASFYETLTPQAKAMVENVAPLCWYGGGVALLAGIVFEICNWSAWRDIKKHTKFETISAPPR